MYLLTLLLFALPAQSDWAAKKGEIKNQMQDFNGWCSPDKADLIIDLIHEKQLQICVDIGTFGGSTFCAIAKSVEDNQGGSAIAIDAWSNEEAIRGFQAGSRLYDWWLTIDLNSVYFLFLQQLKIHGLGAVSRVYRKTSAQALTLFEDESIDFLHIDGNHSENGFFFDAFHYYPKVKNNGYILLNDANWISARKAVIYLLENCELCIPYHEAMTYLLFRKTAEVKKIADQLWR